MDFLLFRILQPSGTLDNNRFMQESLHLVPLHQLFDHQKLSLFDSRHSLENFHWDFDIRVSLFLLRSVQGLQVPDLFRTSRAYGPKFIMPRLHQASSTRVCGCIDWRTEILKRYIHSFVYTKRNETDLQVPPERMQVRADVPATLFLNRHVTF